MKGRQCEKRDVMVNWNREGALAMPMGSRVNWKI